LEASKKKGRGAKGMSMETDRQDQEEDDDQRRIDNTSNDINHKKEEDKTPRKPEPMASLESGQSDGISNLGITLAYREKPASPPTPPPVQGSGERPPILVLEPPVTKAGLRELNVQHFVMDENLRHSINFDPNLHFRPNRDGARGVQKKLLEDAFWRNLRYEIGEYMRVPGAFELDYRDSWSLPNILRTIEEILETLVPPESRATVAEVLDVKLLMQQFSRGAMDLDKLASWLSITLKSHCAPMRDEWVEKMVGDFVAGDRAGDLFKIVDGLKELLGVLEAMKLDVANHQIRCIKDTLRNDTVEFMQALFRKRMKLELGAKEYMNIKGAYQWYQTAKTIEIPGELPAVLRRKADMWAFFNGLVDMLFPSGIGIRQNVPDTFALDQEKIVKLRADLVDEVNLEVCLRLYRQLYSTPKKSYSFAASLRASEHTNHHILISRNQHAQMYQHQYRQEPQHLQRQRASSPVFTAFTPPSCGSSPRNSMISFPSAMRSQIHYQPPTRTITPTSTEESQLTTSLLSIIADIHMPSRWTAASIYLAVEILRSTHIPPTCYDSYERFLVRNLGNPKSERFQKAEEAVKARLLGLVAELVMQWDGLSCSALSDVATSRHGHAGREGIRLSAGRKVGGTSGMAGPGGERQTTGQSHWEDHGRDSGLHGMARLVAHMGILHWRIWGSLAYLRDPDAEEHGPLEGGEAENQEKM
jgi:hypothetical protein